MARVLRIEYENAYYHVMNRGHRGLPIYEDDYDHKMFIDLLQEIKEGFQLRIFAYC